MEKIEDGHSRHSRRRRREKEQKEGKEKMRVRVKRGMDVGERAEEEG